MNSFVGYRINSHDQFDPNFARYMFRGNYSEELFQKLARLNKIQSFQNSNDASEDLYPISSRTAQNRPILTSVDNQIDTYQAKLASLTRLKTGLMQQLLTGKIRVKV